MNRPNFLLFITDQQRADHLGAYGNSVVKTPHIDSIAHRGWRAERCYVASPICMPNRASLMTGRLPSAHGARHNGIPLPLSEVTLPERLRDSGYATALVGKSHLQNISGLPPAWPRSSDPITSGEARRAEPRRFDQEWKPSWQADPDHDADLPFYGFERVRLVIDHGDTAGGHYRRWLEQCHPDVSKVTGQLHAIPTPEFELSMFGQAWRTRVPENLSTSSYVAAQTCELLGAFAEGDKPFFIQCSFPDPHHPFTPPGRFWDMYRPEDMELPASFHAPIAGEVPHLRWLHRQRDEGRAERRSPSVFAASEREVREALALNYGAINHIDENVGKVLARLESLGLAGNTVVIFTTDHGDYFGDHQLLWKGPLHYQGLTKVPLIWSDPIPPRARESGELCSTVDIMPSILERAGCVLHNGIQGRSLMRLMSENRPPERDALIIEEEGQRCLFGFSSRIRMRTLQTKRYRMSVYELADWGELYDLDTDPGECHNLWGEPGCASLQQELMHLLIKSLIRYSDESPNPTALA